MVFVWGLVRLVVIKIEFFLLFFYLMVRLGRRGFIVGLFYCFLFFLCYLLIYFCKICGSYSIIMSLEMLIVLC